MRDLLITGRNGFRFLPIFFQLNFCRIQFYDGKVESKRRPSPWLALNIDEAIIFLEDSLHDRQTQTRPLTGFLGGEKCFEYAGQGFFVDPGSRIVNRNLGIATVNQLAGFIALPIAHLATANLNRNPASIGHGVTRINRQIHENLPNLHRIGLYIDRVVAGLGHQRNLFADQPGKHLLRILQRRVQVEQHRLRLLFFAEAQKLAGDERGLAGCTYHLLRILGGLRRIRIGNDKAGIAIDDGEQIIEVVGNTSCQFPHRFHLLRMV